MSYENIKTTIKSRNSDAIFLDNMYDPAIVGYSDNNVVVYDMDMCVDILSEKLKSRKEAEIEFGYLSNNYSSFPEACPVFIHLDY